MDGELDARAGAWVAMRTEACEATRVHGHQSDALLDLRMQCLDARLAEMRALTRLLARADAEVVDRAVRAATDLPRLDACANAAALTAAYPLPAAADARRAVLGLRERADAVEALMRTGQYQQSRDEAARLVDATAQIDYPPARARALYLLGALQHRTSAPAAAEATLREAAQWAARARDDRLLGRVWITLVLVIGNEQARFDDGLALVPVARTAIERAGGDDELEAALLAASALIHVQQSRFVEAHQELARALPLRERVQGPDHPEVAIVLSHMSAAFEGEGKLREALAHERRALAIRQRTLGAGHPDTAASLHNTAGILHLLQELDEATRLELQALDIWRRVHGAAHPDVALAENTLGNIRWSQNHHAEAREHFERARRITVAAFGEGHPSIATIDFNLGELSIAQGRHDDAVRFCERGRAAFQKVYGASNPELGEYDVCLARAHLRSDRLAPALRAARHAVGLLEAGEADSAALAGARFVLAQTLARLGRDRGRARELARAARAGYVASYGEGHPQVKEVDDWLAAGGR